MTPLQWALLAGGVIVVVAIYLLSRRDRGNTMAPGRRQPPPLDAEASKPPLPGVDQMEMFAQQGQFDELGVGKPRKRVAPGMPSAAPAAESAPKPVQEKIVTLLIAEREGTAILGPKIHLALQRQGLRYGDRRIYHRADMTGASVVFSVASLVKPGVLDPEEQQSFSTPGLSLFMVLPGKTTPQTALADMLATARALAAELNAEVYDAERQPLSLAAERVLVADIDAWAHANGY